MTVIWNKCTLADVLTAAGADMDTAYTALDETMSPIITGLEAAANGLAAIQNVILAESGINYMSAIAALIQQIKNEYLMTGLYLLPLWDYALDDYLYHLRTGHRLYEEGFPHTYSHFMSRIAGTLTDLGDTRRPITTGPIAVCVYMAAAPTFVEIMNLVHAAMDLIRTDDLRKLYDRMAFFAKGGLNPAVTHSRPPDWKGAALRDVFPDMAAVLDREFDRIAEYLVQNSYLEDTLKEAGLMLLAKAQALVHALENIANYIKNLKQVMALGGYFLYLDTGAGVDVIRQQLNQIPRPGDFTDDMFITGFASAAAGPNVYAFSRLWSNAKKTSS
ncbi:MAG: hypothetical protein A2Y38_04545 [Spirochaetes bacterium GWB1_59_5]|nr:MAG: hypothetical protein A2Y38_04545 [Spirochaetes bacterium GWB1_59_5]